MTMVRERPMKRRSSLLESELPDPALSDVESVDRFLEEVDAFAEYDPDASVAEPQSVSVHQQQRIRRLASALGRVAADLKRVEAPPGFEPAGAQPYYELDMEGQRLAIRHDGLQAFWISDPDWQEPERLAELLHAHGLIEINREAITGGAQRLRDQWIEVAAGSAPTAGHAAQIGFVEPGNPNSEISPESLGLISLELAETLKSQDAKAIRKNRSALVAAPGDLLARATSPTPGQSGQDIFGRNVAAAIESRELHLQAGSHVTSTDAGEFHAARYGYVAIEDGRLSILPPIRSDATSMNAHWAMMGSQRSSLTVAMIQEWLVELDVNTGVKVDVIEALVAKVGAGEHPTGRHLIAVGSSPVDGEDAHVEILVDMERSAGKEREDGSIDFREVNFTPNVRAGQRVAWRTSPTTGTPGWDLTGNAQPANNGKEQVLQAGENVRVVEESDQEEYYSLIDGVLKQHGDELSVAERLTINGDVSYRTGNLDFGGEIFVNGSVLSGFSVKAAGDITVSGTLEPGATLQSGGDIAVGKGILGRKTKVKAEGNIRAQLVQEANLRAGNNIQVGNYIYHANVKAKGKVLVSRGKGRRGGSIMGGETWGMLGVEAHIVGTPSETPTTLVAGLSYEDAQLLDRLERSIGTASDHIERLLERFALDHFDLVQIRNMIKAAVGPKRKILAKNARQLGQLAQMYQQLLERRGTLRERVESVRECIEVKIWDSAHAGVEARLGEFRRRLSELYRAPRFHIKEGTMVAA